MYLCMYHIYILYYSKFIFNILIHILFCRVHLKYSKQPNFVFVNQLQIYGICYYLMLHICISSTSIDIFHFKFLFWILIYIYFMRNINKYYNMSRPVAKGRMSKHSFHKQRKIGIVSDSALMVSAFVTCAMLRMWSAWP
jgi:hypothetical protein